MYPLYKWISSQKNVLFMNLNKETKNYSWSSHMDYNRGKTIVQSSKAIVQCAQIILIFFVPSRFCSSFLKLNCSMFFIMTIFFFFYILAFNVFRYMYDVIIWKNSHQLNLLLEISNFLLIAAVVVVPIVIL